MCNHDENDLVTYFVVSMATDVGTIGHASIINSGGPCRQQKQPDGQASTWTERSSEPERSRPKEKLHQPSLELQM